MAVRTTARTAAFIPEASPPLVRTAMRRVAMDRPNLAHRRSPTATGTRTSLGDDVGRDAAAGHAAGARRARSRVDAARAAGHVHGVADRRRGRARVGRV